MDGTDQKFDKEPERYYDWMLWKMRQEDAKMKKGKSMIWVTFQREGIHKYPAALEDPMLATGGSLLHTLEIVHSAGAGNITVVCVIASQEGIANVSASQHSGNLYLAAVDEDLNENAFIVPGLGDAGDRQFGKM